ncbi:hypothetical protein NGM99_13740 [Mesorhizobium sp. RP14(2022)]|uniref:Uncharacterized protein n=1 Tax=Mesorhizobium liriopis TaxID=2953882 RepID=A0ABT1CA40_9HYPH|nr:hypothetical protein [Mesorhizobium liriopis]MCO6050841.1 hypothetical protein [Mesorhizobium liriopis]
MTEEIIYATQPVAHKGGRRAVNPQFFTVPEEGVKKVYLDGDWPALKTAYEEAGAKVYPLSDMPEEKEAAKAAAATAKKEG